MPDITQDGGVSDIENNHRLYRMRIISIWLTIEVGAVVIPFITFPTLESIDFALDGYEGCSVVAFSTKGCFGHPIERDVLREAIRLTVDRLGNLTDIVAYDVCQDNGKAEELFSYASEQGISVHISMNMLKSRNIASDAGPSMASRVGWLLSAKKAEWHVGEESLSLLEGWLGPGPYRLGPASAGSAGWAASWRLVLPEDEEEVMSWITRS
jgi:hypothetical protein